MDTPAAIRVLETCAASDFDVECRMMCRAALIQGTQESTELDHDALRRQLQAEFGKEAVPDPKPARIYWHEGGSLDRIEELRDDGSREVVYQRPAGWLERFVQRLTRKATRPN